MTNPPISPKLFLLNDASPALAPLRVLASRCSLEPLLFQSGEEIQTTTTEDDFGIVAFDAVLPDMCATQLANWLEENRPCLIPLVIIRATDARTAIRLAKDTRSVVLPDTCEELELWEGLTSARQRALSSSSYQAARMSLVRRIESCSNEELEILRRWARGQTNKQIAHQLDISMRTLNIRKNSILDKLEVENIVEAVWELSKYTEFDRYSFFPTKKLELAAHVFGNAARHHPDPRSATG